MSTNENKKIVINEMNKPELIGNIIDIFEDFLDGKSVIIPNPERDEDPELDAESSANLYGEDYDSLSTSLENLLRSWDIIEPSKPVSNLEKQRGSVMVLYVPNTVIIEKITKEKNNVFAENIFRKR